MKEVKEGVGQDLGERGEKGIGTESEGKKSRSERGGNAK